ncbi:MAG: type IX secretion system membrane protein PorP/SprF [Bacteroidota bacterium]|nr:type IX secretion system membrane protein PorP/SprF [Bacteroidota bacterium]
MKKIFCFLFLYIIANLAAIAQQDPQFSFNRLTQLTVNPGYAGNEGLINGLILNRYQWDGIKGSPKTLVFSVGGTSGLFGFDSGIGFNVISDELGFSKNISVSFDYAYRKKTKFGDLGIGTSLGFYNMSVNGKWYIPESDYHGTIDETGIPQGEASQLAFDLGFGLFLKSNDYFLGASVSHINQASILLGETARSFLVRQYYLSAGYNISLPDPLFELKPAVYFKTDMVSYQADFTVDLVYKKRFSAGLNYRINDAVCALVGFELNNGLRIGYAYDLITSALAGYTGGSHELYLSYSLDLGKNRNKKYKSIRYL